MSWSIYQPVPVLLPEDSGLRRRFRSRKADVGCRPLDDEDYAQYDSRTLFYDVFRREENPRRVVAIGPDPVNLGGELRGLRVSRAGRTLRHRLRWYPHFTVAEVTLDRRAGSERALELELDFAFPSFSARVRVPPCVDEEAAPRPKSNGKGLRAAAEPLAMMTLQKDNEIAWIEDWCRWHRRLHDITRFRIYDNGSANIGPLEEALRRLGDEMDIMLVRWPYPYGPNRSSRNRSSQSGALNHNRMRFGARDAWCLHMDVDEFLMTPGERPLREILAASRRAGIVSLMVDNFLVPPHPDQGPAPQRRVWRHAWRKRALQSHSEKCISIPSRVACNRVHRTWPSNRLFEYCAKWPEVGRLLEPWYEEVPKRIGSLEQSRALWRRAGAWWLRRILPGMRRVRFHSSDELFFFHFRGLNSVWRPERRGEEIEPFDRERHVEEPRIRALAEQAGLVPDGADMARVPDGVVPPSR